jgi:hypothetical protein
MLHVMNEGLTVSGRGRLAHKWSLSSVSVSGASLGEPITYCMLLRLKITQLPLTFLTKPWASMLV